jgi:tetratricopeptide (TPR) repeat protein
MFNDKQDFSFKHFFTHLTTRKSINIFIVLGMALSSSVIYLYTASPFMLWQDAPRFVAAIATLGIPEPAEPVYIFLAHWFTILPFGSIIFRIQLFSALLAGCSLLLLYRLVVWLQQQIIVKTVPTWVIQKNKLKISSTTYLLTGLFSMLTLGFSYQYWSQAQNVETYILCCFLSLIILNLLLIQFTEKTAFPISAIVLFICGVATGTDLPVIASIFPTVIFIIWNWRAALGKKRLLLISLIGLAGLILAWSYLPINGSRALLLNRMDFSTLQGIWSVATGQGLNVYSPTSGAANGFTWSPYIMLGSAWHYLVMLWLTFTPIILPFIIMGAIYLWKIQRRLFLLLGLILLTNFSLSVLYYSGNQESWFLQSDLVFALFAGMGYFWLIRILAKRFPKINYQLMSTMLLLIGFVPLIYWWSTLDRHRGNLTQEYITNLYSPIQAPAIVFGSGDLWNSVADYTYHATTYKHNVIPIMGINLYGSSWMRERLAETFHIRMPDTSYTAYAGNVGYSKFMNDFFANNLPNYHIYITQSALQESVGLQDNKSVLQFDSTKFHLIPVGMLQEIVPIKQRPSFDLGTFDYHFTNNFPQRLPRYLEFSYTVEIQDMINELASSYDNAGSYLMDQGKSSQAALFFQKAYALAPNNATIIGDLGTNYGTLNQPAKALQYFQSAHDFQPANPTWLVDIALAEGQLGKTDEERRNLKSIVANEGINANVRQEISRLLNSLNSPTKAQSSKTPEPLPVLSLGWKRFSNDSMNLTFNYPLALQLNQVNSSLVALLQPTSPDLQHALLIYTSQNASNGKNVDISVPFPVPNQLANTKPVQITGFQAKLNTYKDGKGQVQLLLLKYQQQLIVIRIPDPQALDPQVVNKIVTSIKILQ